MATGNLTQFDAIVVGSGMGGVYLLLHYLVDRT